MNHVKVSPYHAASNGLAERMVQSFKRSCYESHGIATMYFKFSIAQRLIQLQVILLPNYFFGRELRTQLSLIKPDFQTNVLQAQSNQKTSHDIQAKYREFYPGIGYTSKITDRRRPGGQGQW